MTRISKSLKVVPELTTAPQEPEEPKLDIIFFLGAGASVEAGVPTTFDFVKKFKEHLERTKKADLSTVTNIESTLIEWLRRNRKDDKVDIELLMQTLDKLSNRNEEQILEFCKDKTNILGEYSEKGPILKELKDFIKQRAIVQKDRIKYLEPFRGFIQKYRSLDIFSVNYDTCIELFCALYKHSYRDGFEVEWNPEVFDGPNIDIRLYKLHGSVTWYKASGGGFVKSMIKHPNEEIELVTGEKAEALMLYPIRKWEYAEPLLENLLTLKDKLQDSNCKYVVVVGYSFRDDYIRDIFWDSAKKNKNLIVVLVDPEAYKTYRDRLEYFPNREKTPSSLQGRVVCLPFCFEEIFRWLQNEYLERLEKGINSFRQAARNELLGTIYADWLSCIKPLADGGHTDKVDEIMKVKLMPPLEHANRGTLADKVVYMTHLTEKFDNLRDLQEALLKRCIHLYACQRIKEAEDALLDITALLHLILITRLSVEISGDNITIKPNAVNLPNKYPENVRYLNNLYSSFSFLGERRYFEHNKVKKIKGLATNIANYLNEWGDGSMDSYQYIELRRSGTFPSTEPNYVDKLSELFTLIAAVNQQENLQNKVATIRKIERGVVLKILNQYLGT